MLVPAKRRYIKLLEIEHLKPGDNWHVDSGIGGSFTVAYEGVGNDGKHILNSSTKGWSNSYQFTNEELLKNVYDLVPDEYAF